MTDVMAENRRAAALAVALIAAVAYALLGLPDEPGAPTDDELWDAISYVAAATDHGDRDNAVLTQHLGEVAEDRRVELTCSYVSWWAIHEVIELGGRARLVETLTVEEWDGENDGHSLVEVDMADGWQLIDVDLGVTFHDNDGDALNLVETLERVPGGDYELRWFDPTPAVTDEDDLRSRYERVMQWPLVNDGGIAWFPDDRSPDARRVDSYLDRYQPLDAASWRARFYDVRVDLP